MDVLKAKRSLRVGVVGLGQCGGAMALSFALSGYDVVAFNTSDTDLRGLDLPDSRKFHMSLKGSDGVGRDRDLGGEILRANSSKIVEVVHRLLGRCEHLILCAGLAGGTGGNIGKLAGNLVEFRRPITIIGALPKDEDGTIDKFNAVMALSETAKSQAHNIVLVDNARIISRFPQANLQNHFRLANNLIAGGFDYFNKISKDPYYIPVYPFDGEDFHKVITGRGNMIWGITDEFEVKDDQRQSKVIERIIRDDSIFPLGYNLSTAKRVAMVFCAPESYLRSLRMSFWDGWVASISELTRGCACYYGLFKTPDGVKPRLALLISGLDYPDSVKNLMESARIESQILTRKLEKDIIIPESSIIEDFQLFDEESDDYLDDIDDVSRDIEAISQVVEQAPELEGAELSSMDEKTKSQSSVVDEGSSVSSEGLSVEEIEKVYRRRINPIAFYVTLVILLIAAGYFAYLKIGLSRGNGDVIANNIPILKLDESRLRPAVFIKINPDKGDFYLIFDKYSGRLGLYNCQGMPVRTYTSTAGKQTIERIPSGIYFPKSRLEGETLPNGFYPMAIRLSCSGPVEDGRTIDKAGVFMGGYPGKYASSSPVNGGNIVLEAADMVEISSFLVMHRTPVIICDRVSSIDDSTAKLLTDEIMEFINRWRSAWCSKNWEEYIQCYSDDFNPRRGSRAVWEKAKRNSFKFAEKIDVVIGNIQILRADKYYLAEFEQDFSTYNYYDFGLKRLYLVKEDDRWRIIAEDWLEI